MVVWAILNQVILRSTVKTCRSLRMLRWPGSGVLQRIVWVVLLWAASVAFRSTILLIVVVVELVARTLLLRHRKAI